MIWWFLILALSSGLVLWVGLAFYFRVRRHMKPNPASVEGGDHDQDSGKAS